MNSRFWSVLLLVIFGPLGPPCWAPWGLHSRHYFSTTLPALDQSNNNENFNLSEMDGGKIHKIQDFGQFWPYLGLWGPMGSPKGPFPLILEVYRILL